MDEEIKKTYVAKCCWFSPGKGLGFLSWEIDGVPQKDMFVHWSDIVMEGYKSLEKDAKVSFQIGKNKRGDPKAICVTILK